MVKDFFRGEGLLKNFFLNFNLISSITKPSSAASSNILAEAA